jgi:hypothetical protein
MRRELDREVILRALGRLSELLGQRGIMGEVCLLGGTVMVLAFNARASTRDVDAVFAPAQAIREMARVVQAEMNLPESWINDGAKSFISSRHEVSEGDLPQFAHLRLVAPTPRYMLAMKCMASRIPVGAEDRGDVADIAFLIRLLGLRSAEDAVAIVAEYYAEDRIPARARFLIEDIFARGGRG